MFNNSFENHYKKRQITQNLTKMLVILSMNKNFLGFPTYLFSTYFLVRKTIHLDLRSFANICFTVFILHKEVARQINLVFI